MAKYYFRSEKFSLSSLIKRADNENICTIGYPYASHSQPLNWTNVLFTYFFL